MPDLTAAEKAYLYAILVDDRREKQLVIQSVSAGRIKLPTLTTGRLMNDIELIDSIAGKLAIELDSGRSRKG